MAPCLPIWDSPAVSLTHSLAGEGWREAFGPRPRKLCVLALASAFPRWRSTRPSGNLMTCVRNDHLTKELGKFIQKINCQVSSLWLRGFTLLLVLIVGVISKAVRQGSKIPALVLSSSGRRPTSGGVPLLGFYYLEWLPLGLLHSIPGVHSLSASLFKYSDKVKDSISHFLWPV